MLHERPTKGTSMTGVKLYGVAGAVTWTGGVVAATAQVVIGEETLVPLGVAVACIVVLIGIAVKVVRWVDGVAYRFRRIEKELGIRSEKEKAPR